MVVVEAARVGVGVVEEEEEVEEVEFEGGEVEDVEGVGFAREEG